MALNACVLVKTSPLAADSVFAEAKKIRGVRKIFMAYGRYDFVAFIEAKEYPEIRVLSEKINEIDGVRSTETLVEG